MVNLDNSSAKTFLKSSYQNMEMLQILESSPEVISGVTPEAKDILKEIGIFKVFDFAFSNLFEIARQITEEFTNSDNLVTWYGIAPQEYIDNDKIDVPLNQLFNEKVEALRGVGVALGGKLRTSLGVDTIRDLAFYPPYRFARAIFTEAATVNVGLQDNEERPSDLLPTSGKFPIEKVQYHRIILDKILKPESFKKDDLGLVKMRDNAQGQYKGIEIFAAGQIDISTILKGDVGFDAPALGALVTFTQSWFNIGVALGQLLHSMALAPGESTRIAMVDWNRRTRASMTDVTSEEESLTNALSSSRSISEVTNAVASELQEGKSFTSNKTSSTSESGEVGGSFGLDLGFLKIGGGGGYTRSTSEGTSRTNSWGFSAGRRDMAAEMNQQISASTHQASNLARNRYATSVKEVSQEEHEKISTRVVTNYNHMHALTVQYYEVVQIYRTDVEISKIDKCLFLPLKPIDFDNNIIVLNKFRKVIAQNALVEDIQYLLFAESDNHVALSMDNNVLSILKDDKGYLNGLGFDNNGLGGLSDQPFESITIVNKQNKKITLLIQEHDYSGGMNFSWSSDFYVSPYVPGSNPQNPQEIFLNEIKEIYLNKKDDKHSFEGEIKFKISTDREDIDVKNPYKIYQFKVHVKKQDSQILVCKIIKSPSSEKVFEHLRENSTHYSQAIWKSLDLASIALLLSPYVIAGEPVLNKIDPTPIASIGNYLVFAYYEDQNAEINKIWQEFITRTKLNDRSKTSTVIPLPSGGVFAEAVLGRSNSAEKIDMTRFWNWQDSPIPFQAPEIAALQAGGKATSDSLNTAQLGNANLQQMNPISMPDPTGMAAILGAIQNGNMFRDMSGLMATIGLSQAALGKSFDATTAAGQQAGQAMNTSADIVKAMYAASAASNSQNQKPTPAMDNATKVGGMINEGEKLDKAKTEIPKSGPAGSSNQTLLSKKTEAFDKAIGKNTEAIDAIKEVNKPADSTTIGKQKPTKIGDIPTYANQIYDDIPLAPNEGGRSISPDALERCDILLSTTSHWDSEVIRNLTQSVISHVLIHYSGGLVVEAIKSGVEQKSIDKAIAQSYVVVVFRYPGLTDAQKNTIDKFLADHLDTPYDFVGAIESADFVKDHNICNLLSSEKAKAACKAFKGIVNFGKGNDTKFFCSELVLRAFQEAGIQLTKTAPQYNSPDKIQKLAFKTLTYVGHLKYEYVP